MIFKVESTFLSWALLIGAIVLFIEVAFFNSGVIFSLLVAAGMIFIGRKWMPRSIGKLFFWFGVVFFSISIFNMMTFKFLMLAILIHLFIQYFQNKKQPKQIKPVIKETQGSVTPECIQKKPILENIFYGERKTDEHVYEWNDINIQTGIGDTNIDLSYTVLPKGETIIFIRSLVGNLQVLVPYDVEVSVNHSVIAGKTKILQLEGEKTFNLNLQYQTKGYENADQKIKILTSFLVGDLEVKRV